MEDRRFIKHPPLLALGPVNIHRKGTFETAWFQIDFIKKILGGIREVQQSVSDSRSGVRKMAIGRHLGERGHVVEKEQNYHTGEAEQREDFINIEEGSTF